MRYFKRALRNEYPRPVNSYPEYPVILSRKLKNAVYKRIKGEENCIEVDVKNIDLNGWNIACCGFFRNKVNGNIVYVNTEPIFCGYLRRYAKHMKDYCGEVNMFSRSLDEYANDIVRMLAKDRRDENKLNVYMP